MIRRLVPRIIWLGFGFTMLALGAIGAVLPLMPTTIFLIFAAYGFARSSKRMEAWLFNHRTYGPILSAWHAERAIPTRAKIVACIGMAFGIGIFWWVRKPGPLMLAVAMVFVAGSALYVVSRPAPSPRQPAPPERPDES